MSLEKASQKILQLEDAVKRIDSIRKHLVQNSSDICKDVKGSINRGIECLHNREINLLEEVNQVCLMKEESLHLQQGRLKQAISILCSAVTLVKDNPSSENHLDDTLERLSQLELSPEETPYIGFRADQLGLMERCMSHGRVDAHGLPLPHAFQDPSVPSACLPRSLEEYDDCQHHIFTKTLKEIKKNPDTTASVKVNINIPKLSHKTEDWLAWRCPGAAAARPATLVAPSCRPTPATLAPQTPASPSPAGGKACSLNSWLVQIKQHADLEEEHNFEIVDNASMMSGINTDAKPQLDLKKWLNQSGAKSDNSSLSQDFFSHINKDLNVWLSTVRGQLASISSTSLNRGADMFQHIPREGWLRSRAAVRNNNPQLPGDDTDFFSHIPKETSTWLKHLQPTQQKPQPAQTSTPDVSTKAQWLLSTPVKERKSMNPTNENLFSPWLLSSKNCNKEAEQESEPPSLPPSNYSSWSTMSQLSSQASGSKRSQSHSSLVWLEQRMSDISVNQAQPEISSSNSSNWLIGENVPTKRRHVESVKSTSAEQLCDWLMVPQQPKEEPSPSMDEDEESEEVEAIDAASHATSDSWSVVSTPHCVGSDQHQRDVAAADDYYKRWLL